MNTRQIPLIVMLLAGAVTSISTRLMHYELETALWILLAVLIVFYIAGCRIRKMIESFEQEEQQTDADSEGVSEDGEVIQKEAAEDAEENSAQQ